MHTTQDADIRNTVRTIAIRRLGRLLSPVLARTPAASVWAAGIEYGRALTVEPSSRTREHLGHL